MPCSRTSCTRRKAVSNPMTIELYVSLDMGSFIFAIRFIWKRNTRISFARIKRMAKMKLPMSKDTYSSIVMGLDTALRRVQDVREHGMENVYRQFYPEKEKKQ